MTIGTIHILFPPTFLSTVSKADLTVCILEAENVQCSLTFSHLLKCIRLIYSLDKRYCISISTPCSFSLTKALLFRPHSALPFLLCFLRCRLVWGLHLHHLQLHFQVFGLSALNAMEDYCHMSQPAENLLTQYHLS